MPQKRLKICYVVSSYDAATDTHLAHLYDFVEYIGRRADVFLIAETSETREVEIRNLGGWALQRFKFLPFRAAENFLLLLKARLAGYNTFYVHYSFLSAFNAALITRLAGGRTFYWNCGLPWLYQRNALREFGERLTYKMIHFLVTGTESLARGYSRYYALKDGKALVMPNWINLQKIKNDKTRSVLDIEPNERVILFVHRLSRSHGAHFLPEILSELRNENAVLVVAGDGPERTGIESRIKSQGLWSKVRMLGKVPNRDIFSLYALADIFLMPAEKEGFPRVLLESMAAGVVFVASAVGGVPEMVPPAYPYLVAEPSAHNFAHKIKELLGKNPEEITALGNELSDWVRQYDLPKVADRFMNICATTIKYSLKTN